MFLLIFQNNYFKFLKCIPLLNNLLQSNYVLSNFKSPLALAFLHEDELLQVTCKDMQKSLNFSSAPDLGMVGLCHITGGPPSGQ